MHPNLSAPLNAAIAKSDEDGGVWLEDVPVGKTVAMQTRNTLYGICKVGPLTFTIFGHPKYCPEPTPCNIFGSSWGGSMLKVGWIGVGMCLEFSLIPMHEDGPLTTSAIKSVRVLPS